MEKSITTYSTPIPGGCEHFSYQERKEHLLETSNFEIPV